MNSCGIIKKALEDKSDMKYYTCNKCKYTFCADKECERCADCGKKDIRPATEDEINQYLKFREEFKDEKKKY